jgi:hypothetical protein
LRTDQDDPLKVKYLHHIFVLFIPGIPVEAEIAQYLLSSESYR